MGWLGVVDDAHPCLKGLPHDRYMGILGRLGKGRTQSHQWDQREEEKEKIAHLVSGLALQKGLGEMERVLKRFKSPDAEENERERENKPDIYTSSHGPQPAMC